MEDSDLARFEAKVMPEPTTGCWLWIANSNRCGYGMFHDRKMRTAHRVSYEYFVGPIPEGLCVCHRCDTPACVNPEHLFLGTYTDNARDKIAKGRDTNAAAVNRVKTRCKRGHAFDERNTYMFRGRRSCRRCRADTENRRRWAKVAHVVPR